MQTLAACVRCSCTYAPITKGKKIAMYYHERCSFKKCQGSWPCGQLLAIVIHWEASHVTSEYHTHQYKEYMRAYQTCLKTIFPEMEWCPNHHTSLHLDDFIQRYRPMHGWWMFPFERVIGCLQKTNTNHKIG